jgi:hypothetical protein
MRLREFIRYVGGEKIVEIFLEPRKSCRYYWKGLITPEYPDEFIVRFYDRFGESYNEKIIFNDLNDAKIHVRRTLLNQ